MVFLYCLLFFFGDAADNLHSEFFYLSTISRITSSLVVNFQSDLLRGMLPFLQFKKREKHPWKSITFSKVSLQLY